VTSRTRWKKTGGVLAKVVWDIVSGSVERLQI